MVQQANLPKNRDILTRIQDQNDLVEALRSDADGQVLTADDAAYDEARRPVNPLCEGRLLRRRGCSGAGGERPVRRRGR
jgi:hypothetical protein